MLGDRVPLAISSLRFHLKAVVAFEFTERATKRSLRFAHASRKLRWNQTKRACRCRKKARRCHRTSRSRPGIPLDIRGSIIRKRSGHRPSDSGWPDTHYGAIAAEMGTPRDARDVTDAIANNTIAILIPCHRVVKKDGSLSGIDGDKTQTRVIAREQHQKDFRLVS